MTRDKKWQGRRWIRDEKRLAVYLRDGLACVYCGQTVEDGIGLSLDHLKPRSKGGDNTPGNLVTCCSRCNSSRGNRPLATWLRAVAEYRGIDGGELAAHIRRCRTRALDVVAAKKIMELRGGFAAAVK